MIKQLFIGIFFCASYAQAQFTGKSGVYYLGAADIPIAVSKFSNPDISGVVCRFRWETLEPSPGNFDWSFVDGEILKAKNANKKVSLQPLGYPDWIADSLLAQRYYYIDENPNHSTYGQVIAGILPWDLTYVSRVKILMQELGIKYAGDTTVAYINMVAAQVSRNLPDTVVVDTTLMTLQPFWTAFNYNADSLAPLLYELTDYYMNLFPSTPLWCSVDYVKFEMSASSRPINYLASLYTTYGLSNYPDRFGLFREDLSGCNPPPVVNPGSHWFIMKQNPCATGAQMLWSVQDGPDRMNQCSMVPNTEAFVLDSAIQHGLTLGMRYLEIYGADIDDTLLSPVIASGNSDLLLKAGECHVIASEQSERPPGLSISPNPATDYVDVKLNPGGGAHLAIYTLTGTPICNEIISYDTTIRTNHMKPGVYVLQITMKDIVSYRKLIIKK